MKDLLIKIMETFVCVKENLYFCDIFTDNETQTKLKAIK